MARLSFVPHRLWWALLLAASNLGAQAAHIRTERDYQGWGWDAVVLDNGLVTLAVVPAIGGRVMQYDLDGHPSIFVNENEVGRIHEPEADAPWRNYGGYKVWPAPQSEWGWPPPPILDGGAYEWEMASDAPDSVSVWLRSPLERWTTPGLRVERRLTIYAGSSRVRVEQAIVNDSDTPQRWSVWDVTQHIVHHPGASDFENFRVYLPLNPRSLYGEEGVRTSGSSAAWLGQVAPGVYGVAYRPDGRKLFADSHQGWIAYVDERHGFAYLKTFAVADSADYPDEGARVAVWVNRSPRYLEVEVLSPIVDLAPGARVRFVEDWWATRLSGPITGAGAAGAVSGGGLVTVQGNLRGTFGVFHDGRVDVVYTDARGDLVARGGTYRVTPRETLLLDEPRRDGARVELRAFTAAGLPLGVIDALTLGRITAVAGEPRAAPADFVLDGAFPNPFNATTVIGLRMPAGGGVVALEVHDLAGRRVRTLVHGPLAAGRHTATWDGRDDEGRLVASGVYIAVLRASDRMAAAVKLLLLR